MVAGDVQMVEQLGADTLVHVAHGGDNVIARLGHGEHAEVGATLALGTDPAHVFLFDTAPEPPIRRVYSCSTAQTGLASDNPAGLT